MFCIPTEFAVENATYYIFYFLRSHQKVVTYFQSIFIFVTWWKNKIEEVYQIRLNVKFVCVHACVIAAERWYICCTQQITLSILRNIESFLFQSGFSYFHPKRPNLRKGIMELTPGYSLNLQKKKVLLIAITIISNSNERAITIKG